MGDFGQTQSTIDLRCHCPSGYRYASCHAHQDIEMEDADPITKPSHYTRLNPEPLDIIDAWSLSFYPAQVLKYIARAGYKGGEAKLLEDLKKAEFYLQRWIKRVESGR